MIPRCLLHCIVFSRSFRPSFGYRVYRLRSVRNPITTQLSNSLLVSNMTIRHSSLSQLCIAMCLVTPNPGTSDCPVPPERIVTQLFLTNNSNRLGNGLSSIVLGMMQTHGSDTAFHQRFSVSKWYVVIFSWCLTSPTCVKDNRRQGCDGAVHIPVISIKSPLFCF